MMFAYLNHNIYVFFFFGSHVFQQSVGNPLGTNFFVQMKQNLFIDVYMKKEITRSGLQFDRSAENAYSPMTTDPL